METSAGPGHGFLQDLASLPSSAPCPNLAGFLQDLASRLRAQISLASWAALHSWPLPLGQRVLLCVNSTT